MTTDPYLVHPCATCGTPNTAHTPGGLCGPCFDEAEEAMWDAFARSHRSEGVSVCRCPGCGHFEACAEGGLCSTCSAEAEAFAEDGEEVEA